MQQPETQQPVKRKTRWWLWISLFLLVAIATPFVLFASYAAYIWDELPDASELKQVSYQTPLRVLTADGLLITEIGEKRREPLDYYNIPERMTQAVVSAEDERFYQHLGVDFRGLARAVYELVTTGSKQSGGSTITMQVARNFYLSSERSYERKLKEIVLSFKIEHDLTKQEIMALYLNKIFLGHRSYGVAAAAKTYFDKPLSDLELHEFAMIAGLPKAPSAYNPIVNPVRAEQRRNYVLRRMNELGFISREQMLVAQQQPVDNKLTGVKIEVEAGYIAEMARQFALENFGENALNLGLTIITTLDGRYQNQANAAVRNGLQDYEKRHGFRGAIKRLAPTVMTNHEQVLSELALVPSAGKLRPAVVLGMDDNQAWLLTRDNFEVQILLEDSTWAAKFETINRKGATPTKMADILQVGDIVHLEQQPDGSWQLAQNPLAEAALVSVSPRDGKILALVGGYDYFKSTFNRVTQAKRQLGSAFKPFLYSAALEKGYTAATVVNDAPVVFHDAALEDTWRPENFSGRFYGPTRIRSAVAHSHNLVPIRILQDIGINPVVRHAELFGFSRNELDQQKNLSLALGSVQVTPLETARAYAVFANGGYLIEPYFIQEVRDFSGRRIYRAEPVHACQAQCSKSDPSVAPQVINSQNAFIMTSMLQEVILSGTGRGAKDLNRNDLAGKTGTTNKQYDAWFAGFNPDISTSVWVGFDNPANLGARETAARAALPIWKDYMSLAVLDSPNVPFLQPEGLLNVPIDPATGNAVPADTPGAIFEIFHENQAPEIPEVSNLRDLTRELFE